MKLELRSISVWSAIKIGFFLSLVMGFIMGLLAALLIVPFLALMPPVMSPGYDGTDLTGVSMGVALVIFPIIYAIGGAVFGTILFALGAGIYNFLARLLGGLEYTAVETELPLGSVTLSRGPTEYPPSTPGPRHPNIGRSDLYAAPFTEARPAQPGSVSEISPVPPPPPPLPADAEPEPPISKPPDNSDEQSDELDKPLP